jgi:hypothetical protein
MMKLQMARTGAQMTEKSLILELQSLAQENSTEPTELLRRAKVVAVKLRLDDFAVWVDHEMNGYPKDVEVPIYRTVSSILVLKNPIYGPLPVQWAKGSEEFAKRFASFTVRKPLGELVHMVSRGGVLKIMLSPSELGALLQVSDDFAVVPASREVSRSGVAGIVDSVRNRILDWALQLERQGIWGEGMTFKKEEKQAVADVTIHNNYGSLIQGHHASVAIADSSPGATVITATGSARVHQRIKAAIASAEQRDGGLAVALQRLAEAVQASQQLPDETKSEATEQLAFVAEQSVLPPEQRQPVGVLKTVLNSLRGTLGLSADLLQVWSTFGPTICALLGVTLG